MSATRNFETSLFMFISLSSLSQAEATTFPPEGRKISWGWNRLQAWKLFRNVAGFLWSENLLLPVTAWVAVPHLVDGIKRPHPIFAHAESVATWTHFTIYRLKKNTETIDYIQETPENSFIFSRESLQIHKPRLLHWCWGPDMFFKYSWAFSTSPRSAKVWARKWRWARV